MFQFQLGAIGSAGKNYRAKVANMFQFQLGAIGSEDMCLFLSHELSCFNSSLVRLGVTQETNLKHLAFSFNSSLVRLGDPECCPERFGLDEFQFQLGAIGSGKKEATSQVLRVSIPAWCDWEEMADKMNAEQLTSFNSSLVRLGVILSSCITKQRCSFNSSLVRLGAPLRTVALISAGMFQFQLGAIGSDTVY